MKALVFHRPKDVRVETVPDPRIENARDVIVRVTATSICGADLHIYNGYIPQASPMILGHEFMGEVVEAGPRVQGLRRGDRVVVPYLIACGDCWYCERGQPAHCEKTNPAHYGPDGSKNRGGAVFGYTDAFGPYQGGQAQYVRVPCADFGPRKIPGSLSDDKAVFLGSCAASGWTAAEWCGIKGGETVAVFGCGPVGLMAMKAARLLGAGRVIGVDILGYRREAARRFADAETLDPDAVDAVEVIRERTDGRGADACIDCVGMEAEHGLLESMSNVLTRQVGVIKTLRACVAAVRRGGVVAAVGAYGSHVADFPMDEIFEKGLRLRSGHAPVHSCIDRLISFANEGRLDLSPLITHHVTLDDGPDAYAIFNEKDEDCLKIVMNPWLQVQREELQESAASLDEVDVLSAGFYGAKRVPPPVEKGIARE